MPKDSPQARELRAILERTGWTVNELSRRTGYSPRTLANVANGAQNMRPDKMQVVRNAATIPVFATSSINERGVPYGNPESRLRLIPVVSWAKAGHAEAFDDLPSEAMDRIPSNSADLKSFAIELRGDSMEPRYSAGDRMILSPSTEPKNGDLVVAKLHKSEGVLCKRFHVRGNRVELTSYNPVYPKQEFLLSDFSWIYRVENILKKP